MSTPYGNSHGLDLSKWPPAKAVWLEFSRYCPQFAVSGSEQAFSKFVRTHKDELHAGGVVVRLQNGTWLGHPEKFRTSIMAKLAGQSLSPLKRKPPKKAPAKKPAAKAAAKPAAKAPAKKAPAKKAAAKKSEKK